MRVFAQKRIRHFVGRLNRIVTWTSKWERMQIRRNIPIPIMQMKNMMGLATLNLLYFQ